MDPAAFSREKIILTIVSVLLFLLLAVFFWQRFQLTDEIESIPVPRHVEVIKNEASENGRRRLLHLESTFTADKLEGFYEEALAEYDWQIIKDDEKGITAEREEVRARLVFHQEKHRTLITVNLRKR